MKQSTLRKRAMNLTAISRAADPEERSSNRERDQRAESAARDATSFAMKCQRS